MKKSLAWIAATVLLLTSLSGLTWSALTASAEDTLAVIEDFEGGIGRIWGGNTYRTADRSEDAISGTSLRLQPTTQYAYWGFKTFLGDLAGDGLAYTYKNVGETNVQVYLFAVQYLDDSGSTQEFRWEWSFGTTAWGAGKTDTVKLLWPETVQAVKENLIGFYMWTNTPSYDVMIDDIAVINPTKTIAGSKGNSRLAQDYENVADVSKVATQANLGTVEITEHGGSNRLTYHYTSGGQYPNIYFMGQPGDFAGTGVSFDWESSTGATPDAHNVFAMYYDEAGQPQQAPIYAANYGGAWAPLNFGSGRTVTLGYFSNMSATAMTRDLASRIYGIRVVFANASGTADFYLDNLTTISPFDMTPPTVSVTAAVDEGGFGQLTIAASDTFSSAGEIVLEAYLSETEITAENVAELTPFLSGTARNMTSVMTPKLRGGTTYYVAVRATDADGNTGLTCTTLKAPDTETVIQDYENVTDLGKVVGLSQGEGFQTASIEEYNGSRQLHLVCKGNGNYPNFQIKGEAGDFVGTAFKFDLTVVGGGSIGFDNAYITTTNGNLSLWSYGALQNGTVTVNLSGYTEDVKKTITGFRFYNNGNSAYEAYVDNLRVVNQKDVTPPKMTLAAAETAPQTVTLTANFDDAVLGTLYMSRTEIDETAIKAFEGGEQNGLSEVNDQEAISGLRGGTTYYFAMKGEDEWGNVGYAYADVVTSDCAVMLYDFDEKVPSETALSASGAMLSDNVEPAHAVAGHSRKIEIDTGRQYASLYLCGTAGEFAAQGLRFAVQSVVTANEGESTVPAVRFNAYRLYYEEGGETKNTFQWVGRTLDSTLAEVAINRLCSGDQPVAQEILEKTSRVEICFEVLNYDKGAAVLYLDNMALVNPLTCERELVGRLSAGSLLDLTQAQLAVAQAGTLLDAWRPQMTAAALCMVGTLRGQLGFQIENPAYLTNTLAENGYYLRDIGVVMLPQKLLGEQELTLETPQVLRIGATLAEGDNSDYAAYTAVLSNSGDYTFHNISARAYVTYVNGDGKTLTLYSNNDHADRAVEKGVLTRTLNKVARLTAQAYYDSGYTGNVTFAEGKNFLNSKSFNTVLAFVNAAYDAQSESNG